MGVKRRGIRENNWYGASTKENEFHNDEAQNVTSFC
jgi:hypothetical protein